MSESNVNGGGTVFAVPHISTKESIRETIAGVLRDWTAQVGLMKPKIKPLYDMQGNLVRPGQYSVMQFMEKMKAAKEVANHRGQFTGVALTKQPGDDRQLAYIGEIPNLLWVMMVRVFGNDWNRNEEIWKQFKSQFKIGSMNSK